ncbi:HTH-type transcriptional regulator TtgR [Vibrio aerogenes CECT 7868]|uniref:HTH-type transcriptional regulator TtgR n=1 Tax=Vibrio aerogenes CECT 7868 TaxID=1216006 RepID=A0A1M5ZVU3_9VIBR|nr:TetR/AcrR family transcriptional regulator [Vibrio aerogenes]SHI28149.1 HTH-type transcriptional regulator TtgR [Vibrio aerogenes CECT 7868]
MTGKKQGRRSAEAAENTRQQIMQVATDLFCEFGYARVSLRMISEKAQISHSLIRHHFGSKEQIWYSISDILHECIDQYGLNILDSLPESLKVDERIYQFMVRILAFTLVYKKPIQLMADVVRHEGERFDYFVDRTGEVEHSINKLTTLYNQKYPDNQVKFWEIKWQMIMFAHGAASLSPFLMKTWGNECETEAGCLMKHWQMYNNLMAEQFRIPARSRLNPASLDELIIKDGFCCPYQSLSCYPGENL